MSRNKDIKFLHDFTGKSYKECRALMKAHHWDLGEAIGLGESLDLITKALDGIIEAFNPFMKALSKAATTFKDGGKEE